MVVLEFWQKAFQGGGAKIVQQFSSCYETSAFHKLYWVVCHQNEDWNGVKYVIEVLKINHTTQPNTTQV